MHRDRARRWTRVETDRGATFIAGVSEFADPPLNDLWTIPGEEHLLPTFQAEDRARFGEMNATSHYHALQIADFLQAVRDDREPMVTGEQGRIVVAMFTAIYRSRLNVGRSSSHWSSFVHGEGRITRVCSYARAYNFSF